MARLARTGVAVLLCVGAAACGQDEPSLEAPLPVIATYGPGTPIEEGLVVPDGAELLGAPFDFEVSAVREHPETASVKEPTWGAVLKVNGAPVEVWNDFAAHIGDSGFARVESHPSCRRPAEDPKVLACSLVAFRGRARSLQADLRYGADGGYLALKATSEFPRPTDPPAVPPTPVEASVAEGVPAPSAGLTARTGDEFGPDHNCFDSGYARFRLPPGAALAASRIGSIFDLDAVVLAVNDAEEVMQGLLRQMTGRKDRRKINERTTMTGRTFLFADHYVDGGGGYCAMRTSRDRQSILVTIHAD